MTHAQKYDNIINDKTCDSHSYVCNITLLCVKPCNRPTTFLPVSIYLLCYFLICVETCNITFFRVKTYNVALFYLTTLVMSHSYLWHALCPESSYYNAKTYVQILVLIMLTSVQILVLKLVVISNSQFKEEKA